MIGCGEVSISTPDDPSRPDFSRARARNPSRYGISGPNEVGPTRQDEVLLGQHPAMHQEALEFPARNRALGCPGKAHLFLTLSGLPRSPVFQSPSTSHPFR